MARNINFEKISNFRDLGGYETPYGETNYNVIYRSASLSDATDGDIEKIAKLGIKTIIDLRDQNHPSTKLDKIKLDPRFKTIECSVNGNGRIPTDYQDGIDSYIEMLEDPRQARAVFLALMNSPKPLLLHCMAGKDRTGVFCAILLLANGVSLVDVNENYMASFALLAPSTRRLLAEDPSFPNFPLTPNQFFFLDFYDAFIKRWGSVEDYFEWLFFTDDEINLLSNLLGKQEKSCGAVVFNGNDILVEHMNQGHYSIPKGHVESFDENDEATALREIKEETGLDAILMKSGTRSIFYSPKRGVAKEVKFFIADVTSKDTVPQKEEVSDIYWLQPNDAIRCMSHDSDKKVVQWACEKRAEILYKNKNN